MNNASVKRIVLYITCTLILNVNYSQNSEYLGILNPSPDIRNKPHFQYLVSSLNSDLFCDSCLNIAIDSSRHKNIPDDVIFYDIAYILIRVSAYVPSYLNSAKDILFLSLSDKNVVKNTKKQIQIFSLLAMNNYFLGLTDSSFIYFDRASSQSEQIKNDTLKDYCIVNKCQYLRKQNRYVEAYKVISTGLKWAKYQGDQNLVLKYLSIQNDILLDLNNIKEATKGFDKLSNQFDTSRLYSNTHYLLFGAHFSEKKGDPSNKHVYYKRLYSRIFGISHEKCTVLNQLKDGLIAQENEEKEVFKENLLTGLEVHGKKEAAVAINEKWVNCRLNMDPGLEIFKMIFTTKVSDDTSKQGKTYYSEFLNRCVSHTNEGCRHLLYDFYQFAELFIEKIKYDTALLLKTITFLENAKLEYLNIKKYSFALKNAKLIDTLYAWLPFNFRFGKSFNLEDIIEIKDSLSAQNDSFELQAIQLDNYILDQKFEEFQKNEKNILRWITILIGIIVLYIFIFFLRKRRVIQTNIKLFLKVLILLFIETIIVKFDSTIHHLFEGNISQIWFAKISSSLLIGFFIEPKYKIWLLDRLSIKKERKVIKYISHSNKRTEKRNYNRKFKKRLHR